MTRTALKGIWAAILTPVDGDGRVDVARWVGHVRRLLEHGCHGIAVFGTTGEAQAFSVAERQRALDGLLASGIDAGRIALGVGCCARDDSVALSRHGLAVGVRLQLALPPFFYKGSSDEGLVRAFAELIDGVADPHLALLLYHFPQASGVPVTHGVIDRLTRAYPGVVGIKDSSGDLDHTLALIQRWPDLAVFAGNDAHLLPVLEAGGAGTISAAANLAHLQSRAVWDAHAAGDGMAAGTAMAAVRAVREVTQTVPLIPGLKHVLAQELGDEAWARVRPPLVELDERAGAALRAALDQAGWRSHPEEAGSP